MIGQQSILIQNHLVQLPPASSAAIELPVLATLMSNLAYYGYALSLTAVEILRFASPRKLRHWWTTLEPTLKRLTGDDKNLQTFVVYKNFPAEVMSMSEAEYWGPQILMYLGFPSDWFTEEPVDRAPMWESVELKVLHPAAADSLQKVLQGLLGLPARWTDAQVATVAELSLGRLADVSLADVRFKENMVLLATLALKRGLLVSVSSATDVLRLAAALSDEDESLRTPVRFRSMTRPQRKFLLGLLEDCKNLEEDLSRRSGLWKRLLFALHPGDYAERFPAVVRAHDLLARGDLPETFNARMERLLATRDLQALEELKTRPGEFVRRLHACLDRFGQQAVQAFMSIVPRLQTIQLLKMHRYVETINDRKYRLFPPKGDWSKLQIQKADPARRINESAQADLLSSIAGVIAVRVGNHVETVDLDPATKNIRLQTSDSELTDYGRGTVFPIPDHVRFLRTASYWKTGPTPEDVWFDNGWNFFNSDWKALGACCWNAEKFEDAAVFSGDPRNSKELEGRACQLIDLYLDKLADCKVRYAVWNVLAYSHVPFASADEVFAALQWGEKPQEGKLFEPSRCQLAFPLEGQSLTKYVAYVDIEERKVVYLDANFYARTVSAEANGEVLSGVMPAFEEYLNTLPTVHDLFRHQPPSPEGTRIAYTDADEPVIGASAYVFRPVNQGSQYAALDLTRLL